MKITCLYGVTWLVLLASLPFQEWPPSSTFKVLTWTPLFLMSSWTSTSCVMFLPSTIWMPWLTELPAQIVDLKSRLESCPSVISTARTSRTLVLRMLLIMVVIRRRRIWRVLGTIHSRKIRRGSKEEEKSLRLMVDIIMNRDRKNYEEEIHQTNTILIYMKKISLAKELLVCLFIGYHCLGGLRGVQ